MPIKQYTLIENLLLMFFSEIKTFKINKKAFKMFIQTHGYGYQTSTSRGNALGSCVSVGKLERLHNF